MLRTRIVTAALLLAVAAGCIAIGGTALRLLVLLVYGVSAFEFMLLRKSVSKEEALRFAALFLVLPISYWVFGIHGPVMFVPLLAFVFFTGVVIQTERESHLGFPLDALGHLFLGLGYLGLFGTLLFAITGIFPRADLFCLLFAVIAADTGAFFGGRAIGGWKLSPRISPKKTVSGAVCGTLLAIIVTVAARHWFGLAHGWDARSVSISVAGGLIIAVLAILGDLTESLLKRMYDVKDSGTLLPGHGGVLDRIDGLLFAAPALYVFGGICS